ncbi:Crp/Fnr family transcriptional regulator [Ancylobacter sp. Lp-2]|uniref:Crp/Fnr family transcriptional regulator n=1 Tax=Ancylobacter sp. Lp-2 TaxID=2881339 RepID=UPI001E3BAF8F|nr:Crp/Fnr family transcriptional regulator [Ancylobacter sp. Lp-2]
MANVGIGGAATGNNLLAAVRDVDFALLRSHLMRLERPAGTVLYEPGDDVRTVYFPCGPTLISFMVMLEDGRPAEVGMVGREGAVGGIVSQGRLPAYCRAQVQIGGPLLRLDSADLERAKDQSGMLRHLFARYADCLLAQIFQSVACNAAHSIEQRTAKWLIGAMERSGDANVRLTQEQLAAMLAVGRSYVGRVLHVLRAAGAVDTRRGRLVVKDAVRLRQASCDCSEAVRRHFDEVLSGVYPSVDFAGHGADIGAPAAPRRT